MGFLAIWLFGDVSNLAGESNLLLSHFRARARTPTHACTYAARHCLDKMHVRIGACLLTVSRNQQAPW
jgi:hypothetical protein